jgi:hypothetical protein
MRKFTLFLYGILFFAGGIASAQDIVYGKSNYEKTGDAGTMVTPDVNFSNAGSDSIEVFVNRFYQNLPVNWSQCYCFINCHPPSDDTLRFTLAPGETASIGMGFNTDTIPGVGQVKITIEQIGGTQKDTLAFSVSTMLAGIHEMNSYTSFKSYPNPVTEKLMIQSELKESYTLKLYTISGQLMKTSARLSGSSELDLKELRAGEYLLQINHASGQTETKKIIKQ